MKREYFISILLFLLVLSCARQGKKPSPAVQPETREALEVKAENFVSNGIDFYRAKKYDQAIEQWKQALKLIPDDAEVHNFVGLAYHKTGKLDSAIAAYSEAVKYDPQYHQAWNNLGYMYFLKGDYQTALKHFKKSLQENPNYTQARLNLEKTEQIVSGKLPIQAFELVEKTSRIDSLELQIKQYRQALQIDSNYVDAWNNLGVAYYYYGNLDSAVYCIRKALDKNPDYPPAHNNAGFILDAMGDYQKAIAHYQKAIHLRPDYVVALVNLVDTYVNAKDLDSARTTLKALQESFGENILVRERVREYQDLLNQTNDGGGK